MIYLKKIKKCALALLLTVALLLTSCGSGSTNSHVFTSSDLSSIHTGESEPDSSNRPTASGSSQQQGSSSQNGSNSQSDDGAQNDSTPQKDDGPQNDNGLQSGNSSQKDNSSLQGNSNTSSSGCNNHADSDNNGICDKCKLSVLVYFDFYNINDLHGKLADTDDNIGVDELTTYLKNSRDADENAVFLSTGDMWQGSSESNMTKGQIITDWMNELDFAAMSLGNHEFDWGEEYIADNEEFAEFPFLAINVYDRKTNKLAEFCSPSTMVEGDGIQIGIIGAIGDCYSSIAVDKCDDVYFKVGRELTALVKAEAESLKKRGADFIVYILHDGYGSTNTGSIQNVASSKIASYYDTSLSNGYVDLVFEGHTHQGYRLKDEYGVYHLQNRGDNKGGISHVEIVINSVTNVSSVTTAELISHGQYQHMEDDPIVDTLLDKYKDVISPANRVLGYNKSYRSYEALCQLMADRYYELGESEWGDKYKIVLGGGFLNVRSPYKLQSGNVTYADLQALFPFDNQLTLCSIKGRYLKQKFFETRNDDYYISYGDYGQTVRQNINLNATYYVVVDTYTANYKPNNLTIVERYDESTFPRDLFADFVENGGLS